MHPLQRTRRLATGVLVILAAFGGLVASPGAFADGAFHESFDRAPDAPVPFEVAYPEWDVQYHVRDRAFWEAPPATNGHHGPNCEPPLATHGISEWSGTVYQCANHFMTTANGNPGYGAIYLTPPAMADWSTGEAIIRFDVSTHRTNSRDWWDVWITPFEQNVARPLEDWFPDLSGPPKSAIQVKLAEAVCAHQFADFGYADTGGDCGWPHLSDVVGDLSLEDAARQRVTFEIRVRHDLVTVAMPDYDVVFEEMVPEGGRLAFERGVIQFGHHSYTPNKDSEGDGINTWHWDEVHIEPAQPFTIIHTDTRMVPYDGSETQTVTFDQPAPPDAYLRFAGVAPNIDVSFDGEPWESATRTNSPQFENDLHAKSFFHPAPEGAESVRFRITPSSWTDGREHTVQDITVWSPNVHPGGATASGTPVPDEESPMPEKTTAPSPPVGDDDGRPSDGGPEDSGDSGELFRGVVIGLSAGIVLAAGAGGLLMRRRRI